MTDPGQVVEALMAALEAEYGDALVTAGGVSWLSVHHVPIRRLVTRLVRQLLELDEVPTTTVFGTAEDLVVAGGSTSLGYVAYEVSEAGLSFLLGHGEPGQLTPDGGELAVPVQPRLKVTTAPVCAVSWSSRHAETLLPVLSDLACQGVRSTVVDMASEVDQRFPDTSEPGITVLRLPEEALDRHGAVPTQGAFRPENERTVRVGQYEIGIGRLAWLAARLLVRSAGCTQPSWSATLYVEQWLDAVLFASRSRVLLCSNDTSPLGVLAVRAAERAAADTVYVQHGAWIEGQTSSHAQRCRHVAVMGARDVRVAQAGTRRADARTYVVGQPRFDGLTQIDRLGQRAYLQKMLKEQTGSAPTRIVVWACQPFSEQRLLGQTEVLVEGLRNAKGGWGLVVAPHPAQNAETLSPLLDVLNGVPVALIGSEVGARGCLAGGDALISASSTCGIEALLLEVPVLELALPATRTLGLADHGAAWRCESSRDVARFLTRIDESPQTVRVPTAARESICHWDGRSADAVADIVTQALSDSTTPHHSAQGTDRR
ncbi:hypothetical protein [Streptomyces europaeiscabiei]|uniref:hypothetical protein n=1 Tax=Streptomyces europaeiscabiei TaxID=146819 RepID=UPI0029A81928|nr:hypothetical protein [Streptomyces europaeiscabiei]MDX2525170.1 hypothetical protein [Streptomyces europaeiscabiei]